MQADAIYAYMPSRRYHIKNNLAVRLLKSAGITALAFLLSWMLVQPISFSAMSIFAPPEKEDFNISDFYAQIANKRPTRKLSRDIVIVDIGSADRAEIARLLEYISVYSPKAIGLDVMFEQPRGAETDSLLINALSLNPGIVVPLEIASVSDDKFNITGTPFYYDDESIDVEYGAANLPGKFRGSTIREFTTSFPLEKGGELYSFPVMVASQVDSAAVATLLARGSRLETIDYPSHEFKVYTVNDVFARSEELTDKIVMIGAMNEAADMHASPVSGYMSGVQIHALALNTILSNSYYSKSSSSFDWLYASILCFLITFLGLSVDIRIKGLIVRVLQFILVYLAIRIGYSLYVNDHIVVNFAYTLLMLTFGLLAADIWNGTYGLYDLVSRRIKKHKSQIIKSKSSAS